MAMIRKSPELIGGKTRNRKVAPVRKRSDGTG
jgi:hypothetical protein